MAHWTVCPPYLQYPNHRQKDQHYHRNGTHQPSLAQKLQDSVMWIKAIFHLIATWSHSGNWGLQELQKGHLKK